MAELTKLNLGQATPLRTGLREKPSVGLTNFQIAFWAVYGDYETGTKNGQMRLADTARKTYLRKGGSRSSHLFLFQAYCSIFMQPCALAALPHQGASFTAIFKAFIYFLGFFHGKGLRFSAGLQRTVRGIISTLGLMHQTA